MSSGEEVVVCFFTAFLRRFCGRQDTFVGEVVEVRLLDFCPCGARILWSKFKVCVSVLTRMKLPMQRIRFGSSTRPSQMVLQWFVKNGVSSLSFLKLLYAGACQEN